MLSELYALETFYGSEAAAQFFSKLSKKYGVEPVTKAIHDGLLAIRSIQLGPDAGKTLLYLTEKGRSQASMSGTNL
jgi:hypothetical protein